MAEQEGPKLMSPPQDRLRRPIHWDVTSMPLTVGKVTFLREAPAFWNILPGEGRNVFRKPSTAHVWTACICPR
ncbi:hypothetical protein OH76DRAFT_1394693 [Lentinus brumalis]|uniref:Uncharacterized protein n=1 Tax=Lentinus brumalis TaxID=2498619 RepID=A0A371DWM9_9APHY|nr:hypothetical protein OH76DRAFT_1394693 [Polyporus brumalis]